MNEQLQAIIDQVTIAVTDSKDTIGYSVPMKDIGDLTKPEPQEKAVEFVKNSLAKIPDTKPLNDIEIIVISHDRFVIDRINIGEEIGDVNKPFPRDLLIHFLKSTLEKEIINQRHGLGLEI